MSTTPSGQKKTSTPQTPALIFFTVESQALNSSKFLFPIEVPSKFTRHQTNIIIKINTIQRICFRLTFFLLLFTLQTFTTYTLQWDACGLGFVSWCFETPQISGSIAFAVPPYGKSNGKWKFKICVTGKKNKKKKKKREGIVC